MLMPVDLIESLDDHVRGQGGRGNSIEVIRLQGTHTHTDHRCAVPLTKNDIEDNRLTSPFDDAILFSHDISASLCCWRKFNLHLN